PRAGSGADHPPRAGRGDAFLSAPRPHLITLLARGRDRGVSIVVAPSPSSRGAGGESQGPPSSRTGSTHPPRARGRGPGAGGRSDGSETSAVSRRAGTAAPRPERLAWEGRGCHVPSGGGAAASGRGGIGMRSFRRGEGSRAGRRGRGARQAPAAAEPEGGLARSSPGR